MEKKRCFVVMGFGVKTDFASGRKLDLNKSYRLLVKPVVEEKGLTCIRADEILHSGTIDVPMYKELLDADMVIADLSTANTNAFYELGIRHALRPRTTIVISEDKMPYPFDLNHIKITSYTHLGDAIDFEEVERFRKVLGDTIDAILNKEDADSPVYTFLSLIPPSLKQQVLDAAILAGASAAPAAPAAGESNLGSQTLSKLVEEAEQALAKKEYSKAKALFQAAFLIGKAEKSNAIISTDAYLVHRLALATYKAQEPDRMTALHDAEALLEQLDLENTNDAETVILAGKVEKRLFDEKNDVQHLANAILYYERGYYLLEARYSAINLAFLYNCRAGSSLDTTDQERIADMVAANRLRKRILVMCRKQLEKMDSDIRFDAPGASDLAATQKTAMDEQRFWILVNKAESHFGLGEFDEYEQASKDAEALQQPESKIEPFYEQVENLGKLLETHGHLLNPEWKRQ